MPRSTMSRRRSTAWSRLSDEALLDLRLCDLDLTIPRELQRRVDRLYQNLGRRGIARFRPHVWLSSEWFSPDGVPGIALPFYLAHPRLMRLEQKQMLKVEGGSEAECMMILRHEAGHAIDTAYRLHFRKRWRETFGSFAQKYPQTYRPRPGSRRYVQHLPFWYAQAHPAEDFAETFAVWLSPRRQWQQRYEGWPALQKLQVVDELMGQLGDQPPRNRSRRQVEPISALKKTLRQHYEERRRHYATDWSENFDHDLKRIFTDDPKLRDRPTAASFIRALRSDLRQHVADWTGTHPYTIDQVLVDIIDRCKELKLRLALPEQQARTELMMMVTVLTMNYVLTGSHQVAL